jgi:hypothetical protein
MQPMGGGPFCGQRWGGGTRGRVCRDRAPILCGGPLANLFQYAGKRGYFHACHRLLVAGP